MTPEILTQSLKSEANRLGFQLSGVCSAVSPTGFSVLGDWLDAGFHGEMHYLETRKSAYRHPKSVLDGVSSIMMLGMNYQTIEPQTAVEGQGRIARYAWGTGDYHDLIHARLKQLVKSAKEWVPEVSVRGIVDTAPLLEREFAQLSGLGWSAKNTMLINRQQGSWFLLAALLLDAALIVDEPFTKNHCGTCTACIDACPTDAFIEPQKLDANRCISYLTIEHRSPIARELRPHMEDWILGCDICQEVCPWNRKAPMADEPSFSPIENHNPLDLVPLFSMTDDQFRARFRKTPLWRPKRRGILRNAAIAMGNRPNERNLPALRLGINDSEPLIRGAVAWALGHHFESDAIQILHSRKKIERDSEVTEEIDWAIGHAQHAG